jgi:acetylornithine deacetylase/succinyl-diaminopimelate desuccinylase-like protein
MQYLPSGQHEMTNRSGRRPRSITFTDAPALQDLFVRDAAACCRFPSISSDPRHKRDIEACAAWLAHRYSVSPFHDVAVEPTGGHPLVVARSRRRHGHPHVLLYGHYDVQPVTPLAAWRSPPFELLVRDRKLFARGASDDKGQLLTHLYAVERLCRTAPMPVDVTVVLDGEEEIGSPNLRKWLVRNRNDLDCEVAVISDTRMPTPEQPALTVGLRGSLSARIVVSGPATDLHAGTFGGAIHNPIHAMSDLVASLHDRDGRVRIDGFYDDVVEPAPRDRRRACAPDDESIRRASGVSRLWGENWFSACERTTIRPALNVTGISGGHVGPGHRNAIPALARAVANIRLVPDQDPIRIAGLLRAFVARETPPTVSAEVTTLTASQPALTPIDHPAVSLAAAALSRVFGCRPQLLRSGGTIAAISMIEEELAATPVLMGFGLFDDNTHAANEHAHLPTLLRGIEAVAAFLAALGSRWPMWQSDDGRCHLAGGV